MRLWVRQGLRTALLACAVAAASSAISTVRAAEPIQQPFNSTSTEAEAAVQQGTAAWYRGDDAAAVALWKPHADRNDAAALFNLAQAYRLGRGVEQDLATAERLYAQAAAQGHSAAAGALGVMLFGQGRKTAAMPLLLQAADAGDARARYLVGLALFNGDLLPRDWPRAYALMLLAAETGLRPAVSALASMSEYLDPAAKEEGRALARFLGSAAPVEQNGGAGMNTARSAFGPPVAAPAPALRLVPPASAPPATSAPPISAREGTAFLQLGSFADPRNAARLRSRLSREPGLRGTRLDVERVGSLSVVTAHGFDDYPAAQAVCRRLRAAGHECVALR